jgi:hypothetical protein
MAMRFPDFYGVEGQGIEAGKMGRAIASKRLYRRTFNGSSTSGRDGPARSQQLSSIPDGPARLLQAPSVERRRRSALAWPAKVHAKTRVSLRESAPLSPATLATLDSFL